METIDLKILRTFALAARCLNFHEAAEKLYLSQPTVSKHVGQLEAELGLRLFERRGRRVLLTPAGERFLTHALRLLEASERSLDDMHAFQQGYNARLTLGVSPLVARSVLPWLLRRFTAEHPHVEVAVSVRDSEEVADAVQAGQCEVGLARTREPGSGLTHRLLYPDPVLLIAPHDAGDLDAPVPDWEELLSRHRLLTHNHPDYWEEILAAIARQGLNVRTMVVTQVDIAKRFIEEGLGVSFLPQSAVQRELIEGRLLEVPTPGLVPPVAATYLVTRRRHRQSEAARAFMAMTSEVFGTDAPPPAAD